MVRSTSRMPHNQSQSMYFPKFLGGACPQNPLVGTYQSTPLASMPTFAVYPSNLKTMYETLATLIPTT